MTRSPSFLLLLAACSGADDRRDPHQGDDLPADGGSADGGSADGGSADGGGSDGGGDGGGGGGMSDGGADGGGDGGSSDGGSSDGGSCDGGGSDGGSGGDGGGSSDGGGTDDGGADTGEDTGTTSECDAETPVTLYLSPDDSNSMSSPVQARGAALDHGSVRSIPIRGFEFMNYYDFDYPPAPDDEIRISAALVADPDGLPGRYQMQIGLASEARSRAERAPMNLTFSVDTSGSMNGQSISLVKDVLREINGQLTAGDVVSMVAWSTSNTVLLDSRSVSGPDDEVFEEAIDSLETGGSTNLNAGLEAGYDLARGNWSSDRINRLVLLSDGGANAGVTDIELIAENAGDEGEDGIYMVGVGVGSASSYHDTLMDDVTDAGKGASVFVNTEAEVRHIFHDRFVNTLDVAARDVSVRLDMPPGFEIVRFSGEEYSTDPTEIEPQHLAPNDAMVFYQVIQACAPETVGVDSEITIAVRFKDEVSFEDREVTQTYTMAELLAADPALLTKGAAIYAYSEALKDLSEGGGAEIAVLLAQEALTTAAAYNPLDEDLEEIATVLAALE